VLCNGYLFTLPESATSRIEVAERRRRQQPTRKPRYTTMRRRYYTIVILLVAAHLLTELHTFMMWVKPETITMYVDRWFIKPGFSVDHLSILWYFKMIEDSLLIAAVMFSGACQANACNYETYLQWQRYSFRLYLIWSIYFLYHIFDLVMFMYNYKSSYWLYITALCLSTSSALFIGFSSKKYFFKK
jgi:hypothetical protein